MIGDRMDTDIISGMESGLRTNPGTHRGDDTRAGGSFPVSSNWIRESIADIEI